MTLMTQQFPFDSECSGASTPVPSAVHSGALHCCRLHTPSGPSGDQLIPQCPFLLFWSFVAFAVWLQEKRRLDAAVLVSHIPTDVKKKSLKKNQVYSFYSNVNTAASSSKCQQHDLLIKQVLCVGAVSRD